MPKAPLPGEMPGEFFVVEWSREGETFKLLVDDESASSYDLGSDHVTAKQLFRAWGMLEIGERALDIAREFGAAQVIPRENRVLPTYDRKDKRQLNWDKEVTTNGLPTLNGRC